MTANMHVEDLILAELDDALSAAEQRAIVSHVARCTRCAAFRLDQRRLHRAVAGRTLSSLELQLGHDLVWRRLAEQRVARTTAWRTAWGAFAFAALLALIAGATFMFGLRQGVARPDSSTVVIAQVDTATPVATGTLTVTERLGPGGTRMVEVVADLRFVAASDTGFVEVRAQQRGESYGVLATVPALVGVSRARVAGFFPPLPDPAKEHYEVWIHIEADGRVYDSARIPLRITADRSGMHARPD